VKTAAYQHQLGDRPPEMTRTDSDRSKIRVLDAVEAAALIKMDSRTLVRWARLGYVPAHPLGEGKRQLWRFIEDELLEWFEKRSFQRKPSALSIETAIGARARRSA
jgi:Helix-turn-helix domain